MLVLPSDVQLLDCVVANPPETEYYLSVNADQKEKILTDNIRTHIANQKLCNARWKALREWKKDQQQKLLEQQRPK